MRVMAMIKEVAGGETPYAASRVHGYLVVVASGIPPRGLVGVA